MVRQVQWAEVEEPGDPARPSAVRLSVFFRALKSQAASLPSLLRRPESRKPGRGPQGPRAPCSSFWRSHRFLIFRPSPCRRPRKKAARRRGKEKQRKRHQPSFLSVSCFVCVSSFLFFSLWESLFLFAELPEPEGARLAGRSC